MKNILQADDFSKRHIGSNSEHVLRMLKVLGLNSLDHLIEETVPDSIRSGTPFTIPKAIDENSLNKLIRLIAEENTVAISMIGLGYYGTITPSVIRRNILENPDWYTAYTPYQPEISQGRLELLSIFQTMITDLTGMEIANASLLDEATAAAEAVTMASKINKTGSNRLLIDYHCLPQTIAVVKTRADAMDIDVVIGDSRIEVHNGNYFAGLIQYPNECGEIKDYTEIIKKLQSTQSLVVMAADLLSLTLLKPPGEMGVDIAVGSTQRFGIPMGFGGPHAAYFSTHEKYKRFIPGRLIGNSVDSHGKMAYRMALQTREQHIRRDKATSNICTSQVLLAVMAAVYAMYHGPDGLLRISKEIHRLTNFLSFEIKKLGFQVLNSTFFDTIQVYVPGKAKYIQDQAEQSKYNFRLVDQNHIGISLDETINLENVKCVLKIFKKFNTNYEFKERYNPEITDSIPENLKRTSDFLQHPIFNRYRSETELMRYLRRTVSKDITLSQSMIPLGSCTMKLNASIEMESISNPLFADIHPFSPSKHTKGYHRIINQLNSMLCDLTGFSGFSFQPNSGSQGEYTGLLCIRSWHQSRGDIQRVICLIPSSAHGTNPASAVMAGMKVIVVKCDKLGNIDIQDLKRKSEISGDKLSAAMITYPSTHGVFEESIKEICEIVHNNGGQVYMDGANMNAMVGICRPAEIGADVIHLNLHKTFAIPHGGGGPGMGPIGVSKHLLSFLPDHPVVRCNQFVGGNHLGTVSSAPWGSALILLISWSYIKLLGKDGLKRVTKIAILHANYIAYRLNPYYPVAYRGKNGRVAHECIINLANIKEKFGITVEDVAKRLIDYGFHAPTMSWPVPDSLMIEPTESESLDEIDKFCDALISIREEINEIEHVDNNLLRNAPHTIDLLVNGNWNAPYSKEKAFFPAKYSRKNKYWPPVGRINNLFGDKNFICSCPPISDYE